MDPVSSVLNIGSKIIDRVWPDPTERDKAKLAMMELAQAGEFKELEADLQRDLAQIRVNEKQAESGSLFVSGARPAIMWICAVGLGYAAVLQPLLAFIVVVFTDIPATELPNVDSEILLPVLLGLLGLGTMRTIEKRSGVSRAKL